MPEFGDNGEYGGGGASLNQPLKLRSAYGSILGQEPLFTNFTPGFVGTLDYIFSNEQLACHQVHTYMRAYTCVHTYMHPRLRLQQ